MNVSSTAQGSSASKRQAAGRDPWRSSIVVPTAIGLGLAAFAAAIVLDTRSFTANFRGGDPGPASYPLMIACVSLIASAFLVVGTLRRGLSRKVAAPSDDEAGGDVDRRMAAMLGALVLTAVLLPVIGFSFAMILLLGVTGLLMGETRWWVVLATAVSSTLITLLLFGYVFSVPLPEGPIEILLGV